VYLTAPGAGPEQQPGTARRGEEDYGSTAPMNAHGPSVVSWTIPLLLALLILPVLSSPALAGRPLITDDTSTQGKGGALLEVGIDYARDDSDGVSVKRLSYSVELDYGIADRIDLILATAYQGLQIDNLGDKSSPQGVTDTLFELKWRFYEDKKGLSFAIKPGVMLPTGNYSLGMGSGDYRFGSGQVRPRLYLVGTQEVGSFAFHLNLGYMRNFNRYDAQEDIWHASLAGEWRLAKRWRVVGNVGIDTNPEKGTSSDPTFALAGIIYALTEKIEADFGIRYGLGEPGYDTTFTTGLSLKF
jgi:hypothetical protein